MAFTEVSPLLALRTMDTERYFTTLLAPKAVRTPFSLIHLLDLRLREAASAGGETQLRLIKLAWWRDRLTQLAGAPTGGEPLLNALDAAMLGAHADALAALAEAHMDMAERRDRAPAGAAFFTLAGHLLAQPSAEELAILAEAGRFWAAGGEMTDSAAGPQMIRKRLRPITALAAAARYPKTTSTRRHFAMALHVLTGHLALDGEK